MKRAVFFVLLLAVCFAVFAGSDSSDDDLLIISGSFSSVPTVGNFKQTKTIGKSSRTLVSSGTVEIVPGQGIVWYMTEPYVSMLVVGKDHMTQSLRNGEPTRLDVSGNTTYLVIAQCMDSLFCGQFDLIQEQFSYETAIDGENWSIKLKPKDRTIASYIAEVMMTGSDSIQSLLLVEKTGSTILYEFTELVFRELSEEELSVFEL